MKSFWTAFFLIFVAELGDKTQFMTLALSSRYPATIVLLGVTLGTMAVSLVSVALGEVLGHALPHTLMNVLAGLAFIVFGILSLRESQKEEKIDEKKIENRHGFLWLTIAVTFFVAELADKTMLATVAIASRDKNYFAIWLGSTLGLVASNCLAIVAGKALSKKLTGKAMHITAGIIYMIAGALSIWHGIAER